MPVMGFLQSGSFVSITFTADTTNSGVSLLLAGYIPDVAPPVGKIIAPGAPATIEIDELPPADQLRIDLNVPDQDGSGTLTVMQDDEIVNEKTVYADTLWVYLID
jgi:hypothetical protein